MRKTVEETFNALLDEEASELVGPERHERTAGWEAYRSGSYARKLGGLGTSFPRMRSSAACALTG